MMRCRMHTENDLGRNTAVIFFSHNMGVA